MNTLYRKLSAYAACEAYLLLRGYFNLCRENVCKRSHTFSKCMILIPWLQLQQDVKVLKIFQPCH